MSEPIAPQISPIIICGPPPKCTCPAVAHWCMCGAWPPGVELMLKLRRQDDERRDEEVG